MENRENLRPQSSKLDRDFEAEQRFIFEYRDRERPALDRNFETVEQRCRIDFKAERSELNAKLEPNEWIRVDVRQPAEWQITERSGTERRHRLRKIRRSGKGT